MTDAQVAQCGGGILAQRRGSWPAESRVQLSDVNRGVVHIDNPHPVHESRLAAYGIQQVVRAAALGGRREWPDEVGTAEPAGTAGITADEQARSQ